MSFWVSLAEEARILRVRQLLLVLFFVYVALLLGARPYVRRLRIPFGGVAAYLSIVPVAAYLSINHSSLLNHTRLLALCLGTLGVIGALGTLAFGLLETRLRVTMPRIVSDLILVFVSLIAVSVIATQMGVDLSSLLATSAVVTAVIGLSLQDTLGNMVAGITLQLDSSVRRGDWVKVGDVSGRIAEIRWRFTAIETRNWETIIVPNAQLIKGQVTILGRRTGEAPRWRRWVHFNVDFRFVPNQVIETVQEALCREPISNVAADPAPNCILLEIGESYYRFAVRYWLFDFAADDPTDSVVRTRVVNALKRMNVPLSIPAKAVFVTTDTEERREHKTQRDIQERVSWLRRISLFNSLSEAEAAKLAVGLQIVPFAAGEVLTRQGAEAHWLYIIIAGRCSVRIHQGEQDREVAELGEGQFFGEMGLLTGEVRTATVIATTHVECFRLGKADFYELVRARPEIAEEVASELAKRRLALTAVRNDLDAEGQRAHEQNTASDLLKKMRAFFALR